MKLSTLPVLRKTPEPYTYQLLLHALFRKLCMRLGCALRAYALRLQSKVVCSSFQCPVLPLSCLPRSRGRGVHESAARAVSAMCMHVLQVSWWHAAWLDVSLEVVRTSGVKVVRATQTLLRATTQVWLPLSAMLTSSECAFRTGLQRAPRT